MTKFMKGEIVSINPDIVADIDILLNFVDEYRLEREHKIFFKTVTDAALRVKNYLVDYKLEEGIE